MNKNSKRIQEEFWKNALTLSQYILQKEESVFELQCSSHPLYADEIMDQKLYSTDGIFQYTVPEQDTERLAVIARHNGTAIGHALLKPTWAERCGTSTPKDVFKIGLLGVYTAKPWRNKGIATQCLKTMGMFLQHIQESMGTSICVMCTEELFPIAQKHVGIAVKERWSISKKSQETLKKRAEILEKKTRIIEPKTKTAMCVKKSNNHGFYQISSDPYEISIAQYPR